MTALARRGASLLALAVLLIAVPIAARLAWVAARPPAAAAEGQEGAEVALIRAGLDGEALAAAGLSAQETTAVVTAFEEEWGEAAAALAQADEGYASARVASDALTRKVASGLASQEEVAALAAAKTALTNAEAARTAAVDGLFEKATIDLAAAKTATLYAIRANRGQDLPVEFLVKSREHTEWHALRKALSNERVCAKIGDEPDQAMQSALATWRADQKVAAAKTAVDTNGDAVKAAWDSAVGG